jgi:hypothetical protein
MNDREGVIEGIVLGGDIEPDMRVYLHEMAGMNDPDLSNEDREALALHTEKLEKEFARALRIYNKRFSELASVQDIKKRWQERLIAKNDPVFVIMELMSVCDARSQMTLDALTNVVHSFAQIAQIHAKRVSKAAEMLAMARADGAKLMSETVEAHSLMQSLSLSLTQYAKAMPPLLRSMNECNEAVSTGTRKARLELMIMGAVTFGAGLFVMWLFSRIFL